MKYCVHGFFQPNAVKLGLANDDLLVLRWLVDYVGTNKMQTVTESGKVYYLVNYDAVLEDLPILHIGRQSLTRSRFGALCSAEVLELKVVNGTLAYYAFGANYTPLIKGK